ncbi:MAG: hypothetical protein JNL96_03960 [Planctomycetaceae bacterium]|nr:hypothetical protein [Planctomycetaceae bacterium]
MQRITPEEISAMRANGYCSSTIAKAEAWLAQCRRADVLIAKVRQAFTGVKLGEGTGLRESDGLDDYAGDAELERRRALDEKEDWQRIPAELLNYCNAAPCFLDAQGMVFHTPAFIVAELQGTYRQAFIGQLMSGTFTATTFPQLLSAEQRNVLMECFLFYAELYPDSYSPSDIAEAVQRFQPHR